MKHVTSIRKIIEQGDRPSAHKAIEDLLALGPNNLEALKLKAMMYASEGRFQDEANIWDRILRVDREDPDAINYLFKQQTEDREHFYFTDDLPGGARRYLTYPKALFDVSLLGFFGCISFFALRGLSASYPVLAEPNMILGTFAILIAAPWIAIVCIWLRSIKSVVVSRDGLSVETRFRSIRYNWSELQRVALAYTSDPDSPSISLVLIPKDEALKPLVLNLNDETSPLRAKTHLVREVAEFSQIFDHDNFDALGLADRKVHSY
jgi:tetratricopeptide (TPR) repeat protein